MALKLSKKNTKVKKVIKKVVAAAPAAAQTVRKQEQQLSYPKGTYTEGVGRRKVATARVRIYKSEGDYIVNDLVVGSYFSGIPHAEKRYLQPFKLTATEGTFSVVAKVSGAGIQAQLDAVVHGLSRALVKFDPEFKTLLKAESLLTRDDRMKETRKIGTGGKARRKRQSPKR